jgi:GT2 family glycosyltransferase
MLAAKHCLLTVGIVVYRYDPNVLQHTLIHLNHAAQQLFGTVQLSLLDNLETKTNLPQLHQLIAQFPTLHIQVIHVGKNLGYGASNNIALFASEAPYHLVLNPDCFLEADALKNAITYLEHHPHVGLLSPAIFGIDGARHYVHRKNPTFFDLLLRSTSLAVVKKIFMQRMRAFELHDLDWTQEQNIFSPSGCCMLFRTNIAKAVKGFDPGYFLYYEDSDIGRRLQKITELKYRPDFKVIHLWNRAAHQSLKMKWQMIKSGLRYLFKWGGLY